MSQASLNYIPKIYIYIYRNLKNGCDGRKVICVEEAIKLTKRVVYKAPHIIYHEIFEDMVKMNMLSKIDRTKFLILPNKECEMKLKEIKEYVFPINPIN